MRSSRPMPHRGQSSFKTTSIHWRRRFCALIQWRLEQKSSRCTPTIVVRSVLTVIRAKCWSNSWLPVGVTPTHERKDFHAEETHKAYQCRCWARDAWKMFETYKARAAYNVYKYSELQKKTRHSNTNTMTSTTLHSPNHQQQPTKGWRSATEPLCLGIGPPLWVPARTPTVYMHKTHPDDVE